ncbi:MAG: nucleotidyltransferase family protein [Acidobacteria bacterium]|nr:nucleotidyltransferase family protein [Acidobacteriota bacterium]
MISGILLAAGESSRMQGAFKPMMKWGRRTVIGECVDQMLNSQLVDIFVVLGHRELEVRTSLAGTGVQYAINKDYKKGMLSSIKTGLEMNNPNVDGYLIALVDQPMITTELIDKLIEEFGKSGKGIIVPTYQGKAGHPIIISAEYIDDIMQLDDDVEGGMKGFINARKDDWQEVPVDTPAILEDIDLPEDYARLSKQVEPIYEHHKWHP